MKIILVKVSKLPEAYTGDILLPMDALPNIEDGQVMVCDISTSEKAVRTTKQNNSMHKYFDLLCTALNDAGWDMKAVLEKLSKNAMIPWSPSAIKEKLWAPVQKQTYGKKGTAKLNTEEVSVVYEALNQVTANQLGVSVPFPDRYSQMNAQLGIK